MYVNGCHPLNHINIRMSDPREEFYALGKQAEYELRDLPKAL
jgi:hypothetical protein